MQINIDNQAIQDRINDHLARHQDKHRHHLARHQDRIERHQQRWEQRAARRAAAGTRSAPGSACRSCSPRSG
ncbi:hypothetical protein ACFQ9X_49085 [Catenulispora yoronensis]